MKIVPSEKIIQLFHCMENNTSLAIAQKLKLKKHQVDRVLTVYFKNKTKIVNQKCLDAKNTPAA